MATMTMPQFWGHMKEKAAMHVAAVTEKSDPETDGDDRLSWLLKPVNVTFLRSDVESALDDLELRYR